MTATAQIPLRLGAAQILGSRCGLSGAPGRVGVTDYLLS